MNWFRHYFIPHEGNEYKPHLLRNEIAFTLLALILVIEGAFLSQAILFGRGTGFLALVLPNTLIDEANAQRGDFNLQPLKENPLLAAAAQQKANDMAANEYFAHTSPTGVTPWYWFEKAGYKYTHAGENLAVNYSDSNDVHNAWMNSPTHRANILNSSYTEIGIATAQGTYKGQSTVYVVQLFGRPPAMKLAPAPVITPTPAPTPAVVAAVPEPVAEPVEVVPPAQVALNQFNRVAVEGVATDTIPGASEPVTQPAAPAEAAPVAPGPAQASTSPQAPVAAPAATEPTKSNMIQRIFAAPRVTSNVIYIALGVVILLALALNIFMKINVQHPQLVLNGLMILLALGTFAAFNQHLLLANAQIF